MACRSAIFLVLASQAVAERGLTKYKTLAVQTSGSAVDLSVQAEVQHYATNVGSWRCQDANITAVTEYCCKLWGLGGLGYHCGMWLDTDGGSGCMTEWAGSVHAHKGKALQNGPCVDPTDFWVRSETRQVSGWTIDGLKQFAKKQSFCNCQYWTKDAYNKLTGEAITLAQGILAEMFCWLSR
jgi:hypothetical protein